MSRSLKKGPFIDYNLMKKIKNAKKGQIIKTWSRKATITPEMIGLTFGVYNGKEFIEVTPNEDMVGHKLGEFSLTTKFIKHGGKKQAEEEKEMRAKEVRKQSLSEEDTKAPVKETHQD